MCICHVGNQNTVSSSDYARLPWVAEGGTDDFERFVSNSSPQARYRFHAHPPVASLAAFLPITAE